MLRTTTIIFSYNRPMQCDLAIKSFSNHIDHFLDTEVYVLYRTSSEEFEQAYQICKHENLLVNFVQEINFYSDLKNIISETNSDFYLFITDDTIFTQNFSIKEIEKLFDNNKDLLNFSFRLGENTIYCYPLLAQQRVPEHDPGNIFFWDWRIAEYDFGYPLEVSSSMFKSEDISRFIDTHGFTDPNKMEWFMDMAKYNLVYSHLSACYKNSVAFSAPMNKVNPKNTNRSANNNEYSIDILLKKYRDGLRIIDNFSGFLPHGAHEEVEFKFDRKE